MCWICHQTSVVNTPRFLLLLSLPDTRALPSHFLSSEQAGVVQEGGRDTGGIDDPN